MKKFYNPAQLFSGSFILLILIGTALLYHPISHTQNISLIDAAFTATSAVCVTGLIVVDTASAFTPVGKVIIMLLIQMGGLGILTFASYFAYFFKGGSSYENQLASKDMANSQKLGEVFLLLKRIIIITFSIEAWGAILIYFLTPEFQTLGFKQHVFFCIFHSISSFCNAGFSTLPLGLAEKSVLFNYPFQLIILSLFVLGGLGFPIVINLLQYLKHIINRFIKRYAQNQYAYKPWVININSKINLITTLTITALATLLLWLLERNGVLSEHNTFGRWVTALFTASTPRTAGYNSIDFAELKVSSILFVIFLMWIGASPNSTGGGIKTSTFAIALLNIVTLVRGKERLEIFSREIAEITVKRAFATMTLSLFIIGLCIFLISIFDNQFNILQIAFECFSAYSTVGLTLGITFNLSTASKAVLIILMFIGRVTMLSIMIAIFKKVKFTNYRFAEEELTIN